MPINSVKGLERMADLAAGTRFPARLLKGVYHRQDDAGSVQQFATHWATEQCRDLLDNQVRGIHFYTLNRSDATRQIYDSLGLRHNPPVQGPS